jgi:peptidoglycan/LPS O-acetylase OafA/YrhL
VQRAAPSRHRIIEQGQAMNTRNLVAPPGAFRLALACAVCLGHVLPVSIGAAAVHLFFGLSGYWIYQMWHAEYAALPRPYAAFMLSRAWRLLPVFYATLVLLALCVWPLGIFAFHLPAQWTPAAFNFYASHLAIFGYAQLDTPANVIPTVWSLDIEMQFYLVAPLVIWLLGRNAYRSAIEAGVILLALAGFAVLFADLRPWPAHSTLPLYFGFFLCGMLAAHHDWRPSKRTACTSLAAGALLFGGCVALPHLRELFLWGSFTGPLTRYTLLANCVLSLLLMPYALATVREPGSRRDRMLGNLSYEVYIVHGAAFTIFLQHFYQLPRLARMPWIALMLVVVALLSWLVYRWVDEPSERLRRAFFKTRRVRSGPLPSATTTPV